MDRLEGYYSILSSGAVSGGERDCTVAIQKAINHAAVRGGNVYVPPGRYLVNGHLDVKAGVTLYGIHDAPGAQNLLCGSILLATGGRGEEDGPPLLTLHEGSDVKNLTIHYPNQRVDDIQPYPWSIHLNGPDQSVKNITLINSYQGIRVGPEPSSRHRIFNIQGCVLRRGIFVDNSVAGGRVENCQFHPHWWKCGGEKLVAYLQEHLVAFIFGRADWEYQTNNHVHTANIAWRFIETEHGALNGHMTGCGADQVYTAMDVRMLQRTGIVVTSGEFCTCGGAEASHIQVGEECNGSNIRFLNSTFWGPSRQIAAFEGDNYISFNNCYFSSEDGRHDAPLIWAKRGRLQLLQSSFDSEKTAVELGPDVTHAIISQNNGRYGVRIADGSNGKAIISDNESA